MINWVPKSFLNIELPVTCPCFDVFASLFSSQIVFEGVRGTGFKGDIALDDITIKSGQCGGPGKSYVPFYEKNFVYLLYL